MSFLDREISFDTGHLLLLLALIGFILYLVYRQKSAEGLKVNGVEVGDNGIQPIHWKSCRCSDCGDAVLKKAENGYLYGCDPKNPFVPYSKEECNYQYRKAMLHGCGVA